MNKVVPSDEYVAPETFTYPLIRRSKTTGEIITFIGLTEIATYKKGVVKNTIITTPHTDTDEWESLEETAEELFMEYAFNKEPEEVFHKHDEGKNQLSLIEPEFILSMGKVLTKGAETYGRKNWKKGTRERYEDALLRHLYAYLSGEKKDPDTAESHLSHIACNVMFLQYFDKETTSSSK